MPSVYFLATIRIADPVRYQRYLDAYDEAFAGTGGEVVAVDDAPRRLEGSPCRDASFSSASPTKRLSGAGTIRTPIDASSSTATPRARPMPCWSRPLMTGRNPHRSGNPADPSRSAFAALFTAPPPGYPLRMQDRSFDIAAALTALLGDDGVVADPADMDRFVNEPRKRFHVRPVAVALPRRSPSCRRSAAGPTRTACRLIPQSGNTGLVGGQVPLSGDEVIVSTTPARQGAQRRRRGRAHDASRPG